MLQRNWIAAAVFVGFAVLAAPSGIAQQSPSFSMDRITVTAGGQSVSSSNYESTIIAAQGAPSGTASFCNSGFVSSLGFFSVLGDLAVPIKLRLRKNEAVKHSIVEMSWTGNADTFEIYSSLSPQDVLDPLNLNQETSLCAGSDGPVAENLVFYKVVAKATE